MNAEAYNSFESLNSDHRIVTTKIRLSVRANKPKVRSDIFQWEALQNNDSTRTQFGISVRNRYQVLCNEVDLDAPSINSELYDNMVSACKEAVEEVIPKSPKIRSQLPWEDRDIVNCRENVKVLSAIKRRTNDPQDKAIFAEAIYLILIHCTSRKRQNMLPKRPRKLSLLMNNRNQDWSGKLLMK